MDSRSRRRTPSNASYWQKEIIEADLVLLAMGFLKPQLPELPQNAVVAGDAATGPSLVVKCIAAGRRAAAEIDAMLQKGSH